MQSLFENVLGKGRLRLLKNILQRKKPGGDGHEAFSNPFSFCVECGERWWFPMIPQRLQAHYGKTNPKDRLLAILELHGSMDQQALLDRYNSTWTTGMTMYQLRSLLRDKVFQKDGFVLARSFTGRKIESPIWRIAA